MFNFEKLDAWQVAIEFADDVYRITKEFPAEERFGLQSQLRRAAVSIAANLAEGSGRSSNKGFIRFIEISFGSLMEVVSHASIANRQNLINDQDDQSTYRQAERLGKMLSGLRKSLQRNQN